MARLWQAGFEQNSTTANVEFTSVTGSTIGTTNVRTGTYAGRVSGLVSATAQGFGFQFGSAAGNGPFFFRQYIYIVTLPSAANRIISLNNTTGLGGTSEASIKLDNTGALSLFNGVAQVGSASSALSLSTWYMIETKFDNTGGAAAGVLEAKLNGSVFATSSSLTLAAGIIESTYGGNLLSELQTVGEWWFDDLAINDNTGTAQTGYPGAGSIVHYLPDAAGDNAAWTKAGSSPAATNYQGVNEVTPDDAVTFNSSNTAAQTDMHQITSDSKIASGDTVTLVAVGVRMAGAGASLNANFKTQIESQASGTILASPNILTANNATWISQRANAPRTYSLLSYTDPQAGGAWTKALIDTAQIGYKINATSTNAIQVGSVWASVEFVPAAVSTGPPLLTLLGAGR